MIESSAYFLKRYKLLFPKIDFENDEKIKVRDALRVNSLKISEKQIVHRLRNEKVILEKIPFLKHGYFYESEFSLGSTPEYLLGYYFLQESSSQIPVEILSPHKDDIVLDMCAAPGSKTTQIAQMMDNKGKVIALDNMKWRLNALKNNLERMGISNVIIYNKDARFCADFKLKFDKILLDAPCSGNFVTDSTWFSKRSVDDLKEGSKLQKELLKAAVNVLKDDGTLIYSTCSLEPEENEMVIEWGIENLKIKLEKIEMPIGMPGLTSIFGKMYDEEISKCLRIAGNNMPPFFIAKIRKTKSEKED